MGEHDISISFLSQACNTYPELRIFIRYLISHMRYYILLMSLSWVL